LEDGDPIKVNANIGDVGIGEGDPLIYQSGLNALGVFNPANPHTTIGDLLQYIQERLRLPLTVQDNSGQQISSIEINPVLGGDTRAPIGSIMIRGQTGEAFSITGLTITAGNSNNNNVNPTAFNANIDETVIQAARDTLVHATSIEVFDETGETHTVTMTFTHSGTPGLWLWELSTRDGEMIVSGNRGTVTFSEDGSPSTWLFNDGTSSFKFDPMNGSAMLDIKLNVGENKSYTGITQFGAATTTAAKGQDGYGMGTLSEISISETGEISGLFTNGISRTLAKILLAEFNNPAGLLRAGDSMWAESSNSGHGALYAPGEGTSSTIKPGALEMSNVDLASEFTDLITNQRGYQANARVISTSDQILQELVQLVR
jgi:flagellar hook protein FlgE